MFKGVLQRIRCAIQKYNLGCELAELLEYRRAVISSIRQAPQELQTCNERINAVSRALQALGDDTVMTPSFKGANHATQEGVIGKDRVEEHSHGSPRRQAIESRYCDCEGHAAQSERRP